MPSVTTRGQAVLSVLTHLGSATTAEIAAYAPASPGDPPAAGMDAQGVRNHVTALCRIGLARLLPGTRPRRYAPAGRR